MMGRICRAFALMASLGLVAFARADVSLSYSPTLNGTLYTEEYTSVGGANEFPTYAEYTNSVSAPGTGYSVLWECFRVKGYNSLTGGLYNITPQGVFSVSHGWGGGLRTIDIATLVWSWVGARTNPEEKYGEFVVRLSYRPSSGGYTVVDVLTFKVRHQDAAEGADGSNGNGGNNGSGGHDSSTDPINTGGFWETLFIPAESTFTDLKDAVMNLFTWGPLGLLVSRAIDEPSGYGSSPISEDYVIEFGIDDGFVGMGENSPRLGGVYEIDLGPYETVIKFVRMVLLAMIWYAFLAKSWGTVARIMGVGAGVASHWGDGSGGGGGGDSGRSSGSRHNAAADAARAARGRR